MSSKITIPDELKADIPQNKWGKALAAMPIIMTVIATLLAGLSSSEMVKAQYDRSLAAQLQSKAGDQWNYFQAKRLRAALQRNTLEIIRSQAAVRPLDSAALVSRLANTPAQAALSSDAGQQTLQILTLGKLPPSSVAPTFDAPLIAVLEATDGGQSDTELDQLMVPIKDDALKAALADANAHVRAFDAALKPVNQTIDVLEKELARSPANTGTADSMARDFSVARLAYAAQRYDAESRHNQGIAQLLELQVRKSNLSAERHHRRSQKFFFGMLVAQMAVIVSTLSMARKQGGRLWMVAAVAGLAALLFALYVYFFV